MPDLQKKQQKFFILAAAECLLAGLLILGMAIWTASFSLIGLLITGGLFFLSAGLFFASRQVNKWNGLAEIFSSRRVQVGVSLLIIFIGLACWGIKGQPMLALPVILCFWVIGLEFLFFFQLKKNELSIPESKMVGRGAWISLLLLYLALAIGGPFAGGLNGLPWNNEWEFIITLVVIPLVFILHPAFFSEKKVVLFSFGFFICRVLIAFALPQAGLEIRAYHDEESYQAGRWERSYATLFYQTETDLLLEPYLSPREFPVESIEDLENFWVKLQFNGYLKIEPNEKLALIVNGNKQAQATLMNLATQENTDVFITSELAKLDKAPKLSPGIYRLQGVILFKQYNRQQFIPLVFGSQQAAGSLAFAPGRFWRTAEGANSYWSAGFLPIFDIFSLLLLALLFGWGFFSAILRQLDRQTIAPIDLFLAASSVFGLLIFSMLKRSEMEPLIPCVVAVWGLTRLFFSRNQASQANGWQSFLVSIGIPALLLFLILDLETLRQVTVFPVGQDNLRYQIQARSIFVDGDILLTSTPPRAYKVLFPYIVGLFHVLFGQSSTAQLFANAWFAILSSILLWKLARRYIPSQSWAFVLAFAHLLILCLPSFFIFYFRFGLIEPLAVTLLLTGMLLAAENRFGWFMLTGAVVVLLRFDYWGVVFLSSLLMLDTPLLQGWRISFQTLLAWSLAQWKKLLALGVALVLPFAVLTLFYFLVSPSYSVNASDTRHTSIDSVVEGIIRIILGGSLDELSKRFLSSPIDMLLITIPLVVGTFLSLSSFFQLFHRKIDLRWGLLVAALLVVYVVVRPTGYSPRFSTPLLPLALLAVGAFFTAGTELQQKKELSK